jgi:predicted YcjX-like family ATPase
MTSALMRGSNVDERVNKFMVLPEEREGQFRNKLTSPLFKNHFENENWQLIYFDTLRNAYVKQKAKTDIYSLINKKTGTSKNRADSSTHIQKQLF